MDREISTSEAAELLNLPEPYLLRLLVSEKLAFRIEGSAHRIRFSDVLEYKAGLEAEAEKAYSELVQQAQDLRMGYG